MKKFFLNPLCFLFSIFALATACEEPNKGPEGPVPSASVVIDMETMTRTSVSFTISTDIASDYAWAVLPEGETITDAEQLFKTGHTDLFKDGETSAVINYEDLKGGEKYKVFVATRTINPIVYSEVASEDIDTGLIGYTEMITLESIGTDSFSFHIKRQEGTSMPYKYAISRKIDFDYYLTMVPGLTYAGYVSVFGHQASEDATYEFKKQWTDADATAYTWYIVADTEFLVMAGYVDERGQVIGNPFVKSFRTKACPKSAHTITAEVVDKSSLSAKVRITPDPEFVEYYVLITSRANFDSIYLEGEESVRGAVIGDWSSPYTGTKDFDINEDVVPNTEYVVAIVGYEADGSEYFSWDYTFVTDSPTGPVPDIKFNLLETDHESAKINLQIDNAVAVKELIMTKSEFDLRTQNAEVKDVILNYGNQVSESDLAILTSENGSDVQIGGLSPLTEYVFGVYAVNREYVAVAETLAFSTTNPPQAGDHYKKNLQGTWTMSWTDDKGKSRVSDVTITDGVNATTRAAYAGMNRLVVLGWDGYEYNSPEDLLNKGWASTQEDADANYGPKWFLQLSDDSVIVPHCVPNQQQNELWNLFNYNGSHHVVIGAGMESKWVSSNMNIDFPVTVSDDYSTLTIGQGVYVGWFENYNKSMGEGVWGGPWANDCKEYDYANGNIVLTKKASTKSASIKLGLTDISNRSIPQTVVYKLK